MVLIKHQKSENDTGSDFMENTKNTHLFKKDECICN
jgi:hypothetical protein